MFDLAVGVVFEPFGGALDDVEFAVRIVGGAVATGFVVGAGAVDRAVVLGDVEVDGPGSELVDHGAVGGPEFFPGVSFFDEGVLGGIVAEEIEIGVGKVGLEADGFGEADGFEEVEGVFPGMDAAPADFAFHGEAFTIVGCDGGGALDGVGSESGVAGGVLGPVFNPSGGVDADGSVFADAVGVEDFSDAAGFFDGEDEVVAVALRAEGGTTDGAFPDGGDEGSDFEIFGGDEVGDLFQVVLGGVGVGVGVEEEVIDAIVFLSVDFGVGGEFEHALE